MGMGLIINAKNPSVSPGYDFLSDENVELESQVKLLEEGSYEEIQSQLEQRTTNDPASHWTVDTILALSMFYGNDNEGAFENFRSAAEKNPNRSEFYYYYGIALLNNDQPEEAAAQFQAAVDS